MMRLYCPDLNVFVDPTDRNVLMWFQQHRTDPTIGVMQTYLLYEKTKLISGEKYWNEKSQKISYRHKRQHKIQGRYQLHVIPWSGLYDCVRLPIFHGDLLDIESNQHGPLVCQVDAASGVRLRRYNTGHFWDLSAEVQVRGMRIIDSAILNPHIVVESIRDLFVYQTPES